MAMQSLSQSFPKDSSIEELLAGKIWHVLLGFEIDVRVGMTAL